MEEKSSGTNNLFFDLGNDTYALPGLGLKIAFLSDSFEAGKPYTPKAVPQTTTAEETGYNEIEPYGTDNQFPQRLKKTIDSNNFLRNGLQKVSTEILGHGIHTGITEIDESGEEVFRYLKDPEWENFKKMLNLLRDFEIPVSRNIVEYYMAFVSVIFNEKGDKITSLKVRSPQDCRLSKTNKDGFSDYCYFSRQWQSEPPLTDKEKVKPIPIINTWFVDFETIRKNIQSSSTREYMLVIQIPTDDFPYSYPDWQAVIKQKWVEISNNVPIWKSAVMKHQTTLKQILYISEDFFRAKYGSAWNELLAKANSGDKDSVMKIKETKEKYIREIHDQLSGIDNSGKLIVGNLMRDENPAVKELRESFYIKNVESVDFSKMWIPDANEADKQIAFAIDLDVAQYGTLPGAKDTGGSNKREASNNSQLRRYIFEETILSVYRFVRDYNQMGDFDFRIKRAMTPTLDMITPKQRTINQPQ